MLSVLRENLALQAVTLDRMPVARTFARTTLSNGRLSCPAASSRRTRLGSAGSHAGSPSATGSRDGPVERLARAYAGRQGPRPPPPPRQDPWATMLYRDTADPA